MSTWLTRMAERLAGGQGDKTRSDQLSELFYKRSLYSDTPAFLGDLLAIFPAGTALEDAELGLLIEKLCGPWGAEKALVEGDLEAHIGFWRELSERTASPYAAACYGDALYCAGLMPESIATFTDALQRETRLVDELDDELLNIAQELGSELHLPYKLAVLRARIATDADAEDDSARELYSELLEDFSDDQQAVKQIRQVGEVLEAAVRSGEMPRGMVLRRSDRDRS